MSPQSADGTWQTSTGTSTSNSSGNTQSNYSGQQSDDYGYTYNGNEQNNTSYSYQETDTCTGGNWQSQGSGIEKASGSFALTTSYDYSYSDDSSDDYQTDTSWVENDNASYSGQANFKLGDDGSWYCTSYTTSDDDSEKASGNSTESSDVDSGSSQWKSSSTHHGSESVTFNYQVNADGSWQETGGTLTTSGNDQNSGSGSGQYQYDSTYYDWSDKGQGSCSATASWSYDCGFTVARDGSTQWSSASGGCSGNGSGTSSASGNSTSYDWDGDDIGDDHWKDAATDQYSFSTTLTLGSDGSLNENGTMSADTDSNGKDYGDWCGNDYSTNYDYPYHFDYTTSGPSPSIYWAPTPPDSGSFDINFVLDASLSTDPEGSGWYNGWYGGYYGGWYDCWYGYDYGYGWYGWAYGYGYDYGASDRFSWSLQDSSDGGDSGGDGGGETDDAVGMAGGMGADASPLTVSAGATGLAGATGSASAASVQLPSTLPAAGTPAIASLSAPTSNTTPQSRISPSSASQAIFTAPAAAPSPDAPTLAYDSSGNLTSLTDADGNTTSWVYDAQGNVAQEIDPSGATSAYSYDSSGDLICYTDADGRVRAYQYNASGQVTSETWYADTADADAQQNPLDTILYAYDDNGNLTSESDNTSSDSYTYDSQGRITSTTENCVDAPTVVLSYQYAGSNTQPSLETATIDGVADYQDNYQYDSQGRLIEITQSGVAGGDAVADIDIDLSYNAEGLLGSIQRNLDGNVVATSDYTYDSLGRLTGLVYYQGATVLESYSWTYSGSQPGVTSGQIVSGLETAVGGSWLPGQNILPVYQTSGISADTLNQLSSVDNLITSATSSLDGSVQYSYDAAGELTGATYSGATGSASASQPNESYSYDANGNRTMPGYVTGPDNELLSDGTYNYSYDADGNLIERVNIATGAVTDYTWDVRNRLSEVTTRATAGGPATSIVDYLYDAENRWIGENIDSTGDGQIDQEIRFAYDGDQIVLEFDKDLSGGASPVMTASDLSHRYLWGPTVDQLLADEQLTPVTGTSGQTTGYDLTQPGTVVWTFTDNQNTVRDLAVCNAQTGVTSIVNHREFDSYGNLLSQTNPATGSTAAVDCLFGFTGFAFDAGSGMWRSRTRPYNSATGRWSQKDLIGVNGGDTNLDRYCGNSPVNVTDPSGMAPSDPTQAQGNGASVGKVPGIHVNKLTLTAKITVENMNGQTFPMYETVNLPSFEELGEAALDAVVSTALGSLGFGEAGITRLQNLVPGNSIATNITLTKVTVAVSASADVTVTTRDPVYERNWYTAWLWPQATGRFTLTSTNKTVTLGEPLQLPDIDLRLGGGGGVGISMFDQTEVSKALQAAKLEVVNSADKITKMIIQQLSNELK